jgi:hypothetical protein
MTDYIKLFNYTGESNKILKPYVLEVDKYVKNLPQTELIYPKFRYYESHHNKNNSKNAYVTIIFGGESYLPGILALGQSLRNVNSQYKLICCVQDNDEYGMKKIKPETIDDINKIYDLVIGVDIIKRKFKSHYFEDNKIFYKNIKYYVTKNNILGLIEYEKIIYLDAACIVNKNIDNIFELYNKPTYKFNNNYEEWELTDKMALHSNFMYIIPSIYDYNKFLILLKEYDKYIGKHYFVYSADCILFYYSIYPKWSDNGTEMFDSKIINNSYQQFLIRDREINYDILKNDSYIYLYNLDKPFRVVASNYYNNTDLGFINLMNYTPFDETVKSLINDKHELLKYFEFIKTYRLTLY